MQQPSSQLNNTIVNITPKAENHIDTIIKERGSGIGFRLTIKTTGCSGLQYVPDIIDQANTDDLHFITANGLNIFIDPKWQTALQGTTLDIIERELGLKQLVFNNPNAANSCGCGESFILNKN